MTDQTSIRDYLESLRQYGHIPAELGTVTIGRTTYSAGSFVTPPMPITLGCRAYAEGQRFTPETTRLVLATNASIPSARRPVVFVDQTGQEWFISGWSKDYSVTWLDKVTYPEIHVNLFTGRPNTRVSIVVSLEGI